MTVRLNVFEKLRTIHVFNRFMKDPGRLDLVLSLTRTAANQVPPEDLPPSLREFAARGEETPLVDVDALRGLPEGTLGHAMVAHMDGLGFSPDDLDGHEPDSTELALVSQHVQRCHDIHHVVTGYDTSIPGEVGLLAFYMSNFDAAPVQVLLAAVMLRPTVLGEAEEMVAVMDAMTEGWQRGKAADALFGVDWSVHWARPLADVRADLGL